MRPRTSNAHAAPRFAGGRALAGALVLAGLAIGSPCRADEPLVTPDRLRAAEEEYDAGRRAFLADQFEAAALHFENAFRDAPRSQVLRNAIRSRQKAKQLARAATLAELARRRYAADAQTRDLAEEVLAEAVTKLHEVRVTCSTECLVSADGKMVSLEEAKAFSLFLEPGPHALSFSFSKGRVVPRNVDGRAGAREDLSIDAPPIPKPGTKPEVAAEPEPTSKPVVVRRSEGLPPAIFFVGVGLTLAAGAATAISGVAAVSSPGKDAVREGCVGQGEDCELYKSGIAGEVRTNVGLGVTGGLAVLTTVVGIFLTDWGGSPGNGTAHRPANPGLPTFTVGWQTVGMVGKF